MTDIAKNRVKTNSMEECRACLAKIHDDSLCVDLFRAWDPPWPGMGVSIAEDLAKLTNIQISVYDLCSKNICKKCCARLQDAINFIWSVQDSDKVLRKRHKDNINEAPLWPKPIQVDKSMASNAMNEMNIEIKQEVVTEDECDMNESNEPIEPRLDIKIEPEEITPAAPIEIEVNGPCGLPNPAEATPKVNGGTEYLDECMVPEVKEEPVSDDEMVPGMPNDCMLCMKTFSSVKELKAHVIALHSYDSVTSSRVNSVNVCKTCNRDFATRTDLFVHETCHSKFACYVCDQKFETFHLLTKHRSKQCMKTSILPRLKTLDDVRRIARYRGTKTLQLFDLHIPISRIREMSIMDGVTQLIKKEKHGEKYKATELQKVIKDDSGDDNDILHSILNDNVMSVVVNLRMPCVEAKPKIEPPDEDYKSLIPKKEPVNNDFEILIPKAEPDNPYSEINIETRTQKRKRFKKSFDLPQPSINANPRGVPIKNTKVSSEPSSQILQIEPKQPNEKSEKRKKLRNSGKAWTTLKGRVVPARKMRPLVPCMAKCAKRIPEEFRKRFFEHYWSLGSLKERNRFTANLVDYRIRTAEERLKKSKGNGIKNRMYKNKYHLKLGTEYYDTCKGCFMNTLGVKNYTMHNSKKSPKHQVDVEHSEMNTEPSKSKNIVMKYKDMAIFSNNCEKKRCV